MIWNNHPGDIHSIKNEVFPENADLVTFTEEILIMENLIFCVVIKTSKSLTEFKTQFNNHCKTGCMLVELWILDWWASRSNKYQFLTHTFKCLITVLLFINFWNCFQIHFPLSLGNPCLLNFHHSDLDSYRIANLNTKKQRMKSMKKSPF